jgi:predicted nucleic acid-binding protein
VGTAGDRPPPRSRASHGWLTDALIAATAIAHGLAVVTLDVDFDQIARAHPHLRVMKV